MARHTLTRTIRVRPGGAERRPYDMWVGSGVLEGIGGWVRESLGAGARLLIVRDSGAPAALGERVLDSCRGAGVAASIVAWEASESVKTVEGTLGIVRHLAVEGFDRRGVVVALGGGITGDVAGFAAALYQRGIVWINCPCTLLAMVDSAVGGKTGVNLTLPGPGEAALKNMVGAVHHPALVVADLGAIDSLPERAFRSGLAECIKHCMIGADWDDPGLFDWFSESLPAVLSRDAEALCHLVARNVALKATVVAADERESSESAGGGRMALNLGHTFGHALEPLPGLSWGPYESLEHGEAVALGLIAACRTAAAMGLVSSEVEPEVRRVVAACGLPDSVRGMPPDEAILERMMHDKKARGGVIRLILPVSRGSVRVVEDPARDAVAAGLAAIRA